MIKNFIRIFSILKRSEKMTLFVILLLTIIATFLEMISLGSIPLYVTFILDQSKLDALLLKYSFLEFALDYSKQNILIILSVAVVILFLSKNLFLAFFYYFNGLFLRKISARISRAMYNNYLYSSYLLCISKTSAEIVRNFAEVGRFVGLIGHYTRLVLELMVLVFIVFITLKIDPIITLITLICFGFFSLIYLGLIKNWLSKSGTDMQKFSKNQISILNQTYSAIKEIKINLKEKYLYELFSKNIFRMNKIILFTDIIRRLPRLILEIITVTFIVLISLYFIVYKSSATEFVAILTYMAIASIRLVPAFTNITNAISSIKYMEPSINIIDSETNIVKNITEENLKNSKSLDLKKNDKKKYITSINNIVIKNLSYSYNNKDNILDNLSLTINRNQKIGIIGKSGVGKSTLVNLLLGLIEPEKGTIEYNNYNIVKDKFFLYNFISYVPQDTILFNDTIKNNITFGETEVDQSRLNTIIELTNLSGFISELPMGLETTIGERGINISGGQKQRIGLARALYKDADIIFFDESTSSLDLDNEEEILNNIFIYCKNKILILISHRKETLIRCDYILKLEKRKLEKIKND